MPSQPPLDSGSGYCDIAFGQCTEIDLFEGNVKAIQSTPISELVADPQPARIVLPCDSMAEIEVHVTGCPSRTLVQCTLGARMSSDFHIPPLAAASSHAGMQQDET